MGFLDRLLGRPEREPDRQDSTARGRAAVSADGTGRTEDEIAVQRYQYLLRTAPPETIEKVHEEAFGRLTSEQRQLLFSKLSENPTTSERPADAEPATLAKAATRAELRQPGSMMQAFGGQGGGAGFQRGQGGRGKITFS